MFIGANEPHAYIFGEMVECMASSDNVVRAGLTPKSKDIPTLVNMLTYKTRRPDTTFGTKIDAFTRRYQPPVRDFCVDSIIVPAGQVYEIERHDDTPSILLTMGGNATLFQHSVPSSLDVNFGSAVFLSANRTCVVAAGPNGVRIICAYRNVFYKGDE